MRVRLKLIQKSMNKKSNFTSINRTAVYMYDYKKIRSTKMRGKSLICITKTVGVKRKYLTRWTLPRTEKPLFLSAGI